MTENKDKTKQASLSEKKIKEFDQNSKGSNITFCDIPGSIKDRTVKDIDLPVDSIPLGFEILIINTHTSEENREYWLDNPDVKDIQTEWIDNEHIEFVASIKGELSRFKIVTRVYYITTVDGEKQIKEIEQKYNSIVNENKPEQTDAALAEKMKVENKQLRRQLAEASIEQNIKNLKESFSAEENEPGISHVWHEKLQLWSTLILRIECNVDTLIKDEPI